MKSRPLFSIILAIGVYLLSTAASVWAFGAFNRPSAVVTTETAPQTADGGLVIDPGEPKDQPCPISGALYTKTERAAWEQKRPIFIMIENHVDARPQSGLSRADVVYEAVAEGGITRFGAVFYCGAVARDLTIGPVRSARTYFVDWASEFNYPLYVHVGGANCSRDEGSGQCTSDPKAQALEQLEKYGWGGRNGNDMNQFSIGYPTFWRNYERVGRTVATEHTMETSIQKLWDVGAKRGWTSKNPKGGEWTEEFIPWTFVGGEPEAKRGTVSAISFDFWEGYKDFSVTWTYDRGLNLYARKMGGAAHVDLNDKKQINASAVVVEFMKERGPLDEHKHLLYDTIGSGKALVFQNGQAIVGTWKKKDRMSRTILLDEQGKEISFVRGQLWIEVVPAGNPVAY